MSEPVAPEGDRPADDGAAPAVDPSGADAAGAGAAGAGAAGVSGAADADAARADAGPAEPTLVPPPGLVAVTLVALALVATAAVRWPFEVRGDGRPDLRLAAWAEEAEPRAAWRDATLADAAPPPEEASVTATFASWLAREAKAGAAVADDPAARALRASAEESLRAVGLRQGPSAVLAMALRFGVAARRDVEARLGRGAAEDLDGPAPGSLRMVRRLGLDRERGPGGGPAALPLPAALLVEALAAERFLGLAVRLPPPRPELPTPWRRALLAARVERGSGQLTLARRLELLDELAELDPTYPRTFATGVLLAQDGRFGAAESAFRAAAIAGERVDAARANVRWARRRAAEVARLQAGGAAPAGD